MESPTAIHRVAIIGAGYMGGGMAQVFAMGGLDVVVADVDAATAEQAARRIVDDASSWEREGLFPQGATQDCRARITAAASIEAACEVSDYIAEVVSERLSVKEDVLSRIGGSARSDAIISSNTSAIPISTLAEFVVNPERFVGVHWMNPAPFVPAVEIIPTPQTSPWVTDAVEALLTANGKATSRVSDGAGFVANRLQFALFHEAARMVDEGVATPALIDDVVMNSFGFRLPFFGPFAGADMAGLDVYVGAYESLSRAYGPRFAPPECLSEQVAQGHLGLKSGAGFRKVDAEKVGDLVRYRNRAYAALEALRRELGPSPFNAEPGSD